jgi:tRNA(Ile)-lysidine synthase
LELNRAFVSIAMKPNLHTRVLETIERHCMTQPGDRIGMGVSGGADSVVLLRLMVELRPRLGVRLAVLHFHHQLRGSDADADEDFVAGLARQFDLDFISDRADVVGEARRNGWNLEDAARRLRYRFFDTAAAAHGFTRVAVAHTADDQAETVLAHLLRGTGPAGLAAIYPVAGRIVRPMLELRRQELRDYLVQLRQPWQEDATNRDTSRMRARIRGRLIPLLEREFEPAIVPRLARLAGLAREEEIFWRALEEERFAALATTNAAGEVSICIGDLMSPFPVFGDRPAASSGLALTRRLIRHVYFELRGSRRQLTSQHVEAVVRLATMARSGSQVEWPGVRVQRMFDRLVFLTVLPSSRKAKPCEKELPSPAFEYSVALPRGSHSTSIVIPEIRRRLNLKVIDWPAASEETMGGVGTLDFDRLHRPLIFRNWRPGDSYRPYHRRSVRKLKRMLLERRIPARDRASWPVLTSAGMPVWALGCPVADEFAPRSETRVGVVILEEAL